MKIADHIFEQSSQPFQYTGRENDGATGLYYYRSRYYSPHMGRFISEDPIGFVGGINFYSYTFNSPVNFTDPFGLYKRDVHDDLTFNLAQQTCFSEAEATTIASANQAMDDNWSTSPWNLWSGNQYHFMSPAEAQTNMAAAIQSRNLNTFGSALHSLQDTFSHYLKGYTWQHVTAGNRPDNFEMCPNREDVIEATLNNLRALCAALGR